MKVLITGAAGYFGGAILPALAADPGVTAIVATDLRAPAFTHPKLTFVARDLVAEGADDLAAAADAIVHLAFTVERRPGVDPGVLNIQANRRFLAAAVAHAQVVLFASSVMAYGFREAGTDKLREDDAPAPGRGFYYAEQKIASEQMLGEIAATGSARVVIARPCAVGGPTLDTRRAALYRGWLQVMPSVPHPLRVQLLHEADLGEAFRVLLQAPAGVYNVAPDDDLTTDEVAKLLGQWRLSLPMGLCAWVMDQAWRRGQGLMDGEWARTLAWPAQVADNAKLRGLGWTPAWTTRRTIAQVAAAG